MTYNIVYDTTDCIYIAHCRELGISAHGKTISEALSELRKAISATLK